MRIRNVTGIVMRNYALTFKTLVYKLATFILFAIAIGLTLKIRLRGLFDAIHPVINDIIAVIRNLFVGGGEPITATNLNDHFRDLINYLSGNVGGMVLTGVISFVLVFLYRYVNEISDCAAMISIDYHMSSLTKKPYFAILFENLKTILLYELVEVALALVFALATIAVGYSLTLVLINTLPAITPCVILAFFIACQGFYNTMTSQFMAKALLEKKGVKTALIEGFRPQKGCFWKMFASYSLVNLVIFYLITSTAVFTFGVGTLFLIPLGSVVVAGMKTVDYYVLNTRKYFIDYDNIVIPKELRENDEQLLKDVEI